MQSVGTDVLDVAHVKLCTAHPSRCPSTISRSRLASCFTVTPHVPPRQRLPLPVVPRYLVCMFALSDLTVSSLDEASVRGGALCREYILFSLVSTEDFWLRHCPPGRQKLRSNTCLHGRYVGVLANRSQLLGRRGALTTIRALCGVASCWEACPC